MTEKNKALRSMHKDCKAKSKGVTKIWTRTQLVGYKTIGVPYVEAIHGLIGSDKVRAEKRRKELESRQTK